MKKIPGKESIFKGIKTLNLLKCEYELFFLKKCLFNFQIVSHAFSEEEHRTPALVPGGPVRRDYQ